MVLDQNSVDKISAQLSAIYDLQCRSALNREYYGILLTRTQRKNTILEILIALGTAGSGISGLALFEYQVGKLAWASITAAATILAVIKPVVQYSKKIERLSRLFSGYAEIYVSLSIAVSKIKISCELTPEVSGIFEAASERYVELSREDDPMPNRKLLKRCEYTVRQQHPPERAWYPRTD